MSGTSHRPLMDPEEARWVRPTPPPDPLLLVIVAGAGKLPARGPDATRNWQYLRAPSRDNPGVAGPGESLRLSLIVVGVAVAILALAGLLVWLLLS